MGAPNTITPVIIIKLVGSSIRSHAVSTLDTGFLAISCLHFIDLALVGWLPSDDSAVGFSVPFYSSASCPLLAAPLLAAPLLAAQRREHPFWLAPSSFDNQTSLV
jgi:hypothetical protein